MMTQESLPHQLQNRWPDTDNYLERVGQINNDLMVMREFQAAQNHIPDFLERLAIGPGDLMKEPDGEEQLRFLYQQGIRVKSVEALPTFIEAQQEYRREKDDETMDILEDSYRTIFFQAEAKIVAGMPEMQSKLTAWATQMLQMYAPTYQEPLSYLQVLMLLRLTVFLDQEDAGAEWREDSVRSLLSTSFFEKAAPRQ